jgi:hypothetical protein
MCWPMRLSRSGLPGHELEAETVVDHGEAATDEVGDFSETAADVVAGSHRKVGQPSLSRRLLADPFDL